MREVRFLVLRTAWRHNSTPSEISQVSNASLARLFGSKNLDWNLRAYFHAATFGHLDIVPPHIVDIGPLPVDAPVQRPDKTWTSLNRRGTVHAALSLAPADIAPTDYDGVIVWVDAPADSGALTSYSWHDPGGTPHFINAAVLDQTHGLTFYQHEIGHVLGYGHSHGPAVPSIDDDGNQITRADGTVQLTKVYQDYACVMSGLSFGGQDASAPTLRTVGVPAPQLAGLWGTDSGPLPSAAATYIFGDFAYRISALPRLRGSATIVDFAGWQAGAVTRRLYAATEPYGLPGITPELARLATLTAEGSEWLIEYRVAEGWDAGLAHTGIQIRRRQAAKTKQPIMEVGPEWQGEISFGRTALGDRDWTSPQGSFTVTVERTSAPDQPTRWADVTVTAAASAPKALLSVTTDYAAPLRIPKTTGRRTLDTMCFSGDYGFWVEGRDASVAVTLVNYGFVAPYVSWSIDGRPAVPGSMTMQPRGTYPFPEGPVAARFDFDLDAIAFTDTAMTFTVSGLGGRRDIDVSCHVEETAPGVPSSGITVHSTVSIDGPALQWDSRYFDDFARCVLARIPRIAGATWPVVGPSDGPDMDGALAAAQHIPAIEDGRFDLVEAIATRFGIGIEAAVIRTEPDLPGRRATPDADTPQPGRTLR